MSRYSSLFAACGVAAVLTFGPAPARAAEPAAVDAPNAPPAKAPSDGAKPDEPAAPPDAAPVPDDPAFDSFADLVLLGDAWARLDAGLMTDVGLQLAEGERVLGRTHKGDVTARKVLATAATLAAKQKDRPALERLAKAADARGDKELAAQAAAALKLAGASRDVDPALIVSADETTPEAFALYRGYVQDIEAAQVGGDRRALDQIDKELSEFDFLSPQQREHLKKLSGEARSALPKDQPAADEWAVELNKLANASRGGLPTKLKKYKFPEPKPLPIHGPDLSKWGKTPMPTPHWKFPPHPPVNVNIGTGSDQGNGQQGHTEQGPYGTGGDSSQFIRRPFIPPSLPNGLW